MDNGEETIHLVLPKIDKSDPTPKYLQAQKILAEAIRLGQLRAGSKLPSTKAIGGLVNVSLITAHKALERLVDAGLVRREVGRGTYVCDNVQDVMESARQLSIGLVLDPRVDIGDYYHNTIIDGLRRAARADTQCAELFFQEKLTLSHRRRTATAGMVCLHPSLADQPEVLQLARLLPVVVLGGTIPGDAVACVDCDNYTGAREAVRHLTELGHRRFVVLSAARLELTNSRDRELGARQELAEQGIPFEDRDSIVSQDPVELDQEACEALRQRLVEPDRPTAIVAGGFYLALGAMRAIRQVGLTVPHDVSIIGFDDPASAPMLDPPLTTVRQPLFEMAAKAYTTLRQAILDGNGGVSSCKLPSELVIRGTTTHCTTN